MTSVEGGGVLDFKGQRERGMNLVLLSLFSPFHKSLLFQILLSILAMCS